MRIESIPSIFTAADEPVDPKGTPTNIGETFAAIMDQLGMGPARFPEKSTGKMSPQDPTVCEAGLDLVDARQEAIPASPMSKAHPSDHECDSEDTPADQSSDPSIETSANFHRAPLVLMKPVAVALPDALTIKPATSIPDCAVMPLGVFAGSDAKSGAEAFISQTRLAGREYLGSGETGPMPPALVTTGIETKTAVDPRSGGSTHDPGHESGPIRTSGAEEVGPEALNDRPVNKAVVPLLRLVESAGSQIDSAKSTARTDDPVPSSQPGPAPKEGVNSAPAPEPHVPAAGQGTELPVSPQLPGADMPTPIGSHVSGQAMLGSERQRSDRGEIMASVRAGNEMQSGVEILVSQVRLAGSEYAGSGETGPIPQRPVTTGGETNVAGDPRSDVPAHEPDHNGGPIRISGAEGDSPEVLKDRPAIKAMVPLLHFPESAVSRVDGARSTAATGDPIPASRPGPAQNEVTKGTTAAELQVSAARQGAESPASKQLPGAGGTIPIGSHVSAQDTSTVDRRQSDPDGVMPRIFSDSRTSSPSAPSSLAPKAADMSVSTPLQYTEGMASRAGFLFEVAERIAMVARRSTHEVTIQLKPDHLGRISLIAQSGADGLVARITAESAGVRQFLENNLPILQQSLQEQGLKVNHIEVLAQRSDPQNLGGMWQQRPGNSHQEQQHSEQSWISGVALGQAYPATSELLMDHWTFAALYPHSTFHTIA